MKLDRHWSLPVMLLFLLVLLTLWETAIAEHSDTEKQEAKGRISFELPWRIEAKVEINLTAKFIGLASKSVGNTAEMAELIQMLDGIYVRTYDRKTVNDQELVNYFRQKLKENKWRTPIKIERENETVEINLLLDENTVYGIFVIMIPKMPEEVIFVNIIGKIDPEHVEDLLRNLSNFGAIDINVGDKLKAQAAPIRNTVQRELPAVKIDDPPRVDGILDDACWEIAPQADNFTQVNTENLVEDNTVVKVVYTPKAIYVGWHLHDSQPDKIVARQTRDQIRFDNAIEDWVSFSLDPSHTHQFANRTFFMANPLGKKYVRMSVESTNRNKWIDQWNVAAKIVEDGWVVEMEIPWEMLAYPETTQPIQMGINFDRFQARPRTHSWWSNIGSTEYYKYDGHWLNVLPPPKSSNRQPRRDTLIGTVVQEQTNPDGSLILYLSFDELDGHIVNDHSQYGNNGELVGNPILVEGKFGKALKLNGRSDWVEIPHDDSLTVDESVTVMAWIKTPRHGGPREALWQGIVAKGNNPQSYSFYTYKRSGGLELNVGRFRRSYSEQNIALNRWQHVAVQVDNGIHRHWINGEPAGVVLVDATLPGRTDTASVRVGNAHTVKPAGTPDRHFLGLIDELRIWNRALSHDEIITQMNTGNKFAQYADEPSEAWQSSEKK